MTFRVAAESLPGLLESAANQYLASAFSAGSIGDALREKIVAEAPTPERLLAAWLARLIEVMNEHRMRFRSVQIRDLREESGIWRVRADAMGELFDPHRHPEARCPPAQIASIQNVEEYWTAEIHLRI